jgi:hypothetical protein
MENGKHAPLTHSERLERDELLRLLACFIFEVQVIWLGEGIDDDNHQTDAKTVLDHLENLIKYAPPAVMELVEHLRENPPTKYKDDSAIYGYTFPFIQWHCPNDHLCI